MSASTISQPLAWSASTVSQLLPHMLAPHSAPRDAAEQKLAVKEDYEALVPSGGAAEKG